jgi:hypothetical protein
MRRTTLKVCLSGQANESGKRLTKLDHKKLQFGDDHGDWISNTIA